MIRSLKEVMDGKKPEARKVLSSIIIEELPDKQIQVTVSKSDGWSTKLYPSGTNIKVVAE